MTCSVDGCDRPHHALGMCRTHYLRAWRSGGDTSQRQRYTPPGEAIAYFEAAIAGAGNEHLWWPYSRTSGGYGHLRVDGRYVTVHALACERAHGPRPEGMQVRHLCGPNAGCFNPRHLSWGTSKEDAADRLRYRTEGIVPAVDPYRRNTP